MAADIRLPLTVRQHISWIGATRLPPVWAFIDTGRVSQRTACEQINARLRLIKLIGKVLTGQSVQTTREQANDRASAVGPPKQQNRSVRTSACIRAAN